MVAGTISSVGGRDDREAWVIPLIATATAAYVVTGIILASAAGDALITTVPTYKAEFNWAFTAANDHRALALIDEGRADVAALYRRLEYVSTLLIAFSVVVGGIGAFLRPRLAEADPLVLMGLTVASVAAYSWFANGGAFLDWLRSVGAIPASIGGWPGLWFASIGLATLLIAWTAGLLLHDVLVLALTRRGRPGPGGA